MAPPLTDSRGDWSGGVVIIVFPDRAHARAWYASPAYRAILPLRTANSTAEVILIDGVDPDHRATDILAGAEPASSNAQSGS